MKNFFFAVALITPAIWAADAWESKPFEDWTSKDLQKVVNGSPWARQTTAFLSGGASQRDRSGIGDSSNDIPGGRASRGAGSAGGADRLGASPADFDTTGQSAATAVPVVIRWQSALPLRQAQMRARYGKEAATAPEAQKFLAQEPMLYVLVISGLQGSVVSGGAGDEAKRNIMENTRLTPKGKTALRPVVVDFAPNGTTVDVLIGFPKTTPLALEDQEAELSSQIGPAQVSYKFKLKDMVLHGKLEL
jgi:hypothetical protein